MPHSPAATGARQGLPFFEGGRPNRGILLGPLKRETGPIAPLYRRATGLVQRASLWHFRGFDFYIVDLSQLSRRLNTSLNHGFGNFQVVAMRYVLASSEN